MPADRPCTVCGHSPVVAKELCNKHYRRLRRNGDPNIAGHHSKSRHAPGTVEHFQENTVEMPGPLETPCLHWKRARTEAGYGVISTQPLQYAHRFSYETFVGPVEPGLYVCHRCDVPQCCNPSHLFLGTSQENNRDMVDKGRGKKYRKLTDEDVREIRNNPDNLKYRELAEKFSINMSTVYSIKAGRINTNVS